MPNDDIDVRGAYLALLGHEAPAGRLAVTDTSVEVAGGRVVLAIDERGRRCVLVPSSRTPQPDKSSRGVSLAVAEYVEPDLARTRYLVLRCEVGEFNDLFVSIASDVIRAVAADPQNPEKSCYGVLARYRELFGPADSELLTPAALAALFAELLVVDELVDAGGHVGQWRGPERHRHDIIGPGAAIEVKSTLSSEHRRIVVHGARQLEPPPDRQLFVHLVRLEPAIGGRTVQDLVDQIVDRGGDPADLKRLLVGIGYHPIDAPNYAEIQFSLIEQETHEVDDSFPRLPHQVMAQLPAGISELRYTLDLSTAGRDPLEKGLEVAVLAARDTA